MYVGIEAACWRYFGRDASDLSWSEAALLAVLPNNPSLIHPGRNRDQLKAKRDRLLKRMQEAEIIDELTFELSVSEAIPENPLPLPRGAFHLLAHSSKRRTCSNPDSINSFAYHSRTG
ncbi:MAG: transglycosylase domain-containing protein [Cytophagales bacterium]|nr:transglycosylase domain-containing protein [Cytophagales bacterium]